MNEFKIKTKKEINWPFIIRAIYCFLLCFFTFLTICIWSRAGLFSFKHLFIFTLFAIPLSILYAYTVERIGYGLGGILTGWTTRKIPSREQLSADLARARYSKGRGQFKEALCIINQVLEKDPDFPDALFLKAHILWEGFRNSTGALENLTRILELVKDGEPIYSWAVNYYHEVKKGQRIEN